MTTSTEFCRQLIDVWPDAVGLSRFLKTSGTPDDVPGYLYWDLCNSYTRRKWYGTDDAEWMDYRMLWTWRQSPEESQRSLQIQKTLWSMDVGAHSNRLFMSNDENVSVVYRWVGGLETRTRFGADRNKSFYTREFLQNPTQLKLPVTDQQFGEFIRNALPDFVAWGAFKTGYRVDTHHRFEVVPTPLLEILFWTGRTLCHTDATVA